MTSTKGVDKVRDVVLAALIPFAFIVVTPWNNLDGINPAKFLVIVSLGTIAFALILFQLVGKFSFKDLELFHYVALISVFLILISTLINRYSIDERLFGIYGRSLGAITFATLFLISFTASLYNKEKLELLIITLLISLFSVAAYLVVQRAGLDLASWEDAYGGNPSSTLGNPNFVSSSLSILSGPLLAVLLFKTRLALFIRIGMTPLIALISFLIWETQSIQGLIIVIINFLALLLILINEVFSNRLKKLIQSLTILIITVIPVATLLLALGFVPSLGGATLMARTYYWRAAWNLILENPFFGKGFDSFGDWYWTYRDQLAVDRGPGLFTDSTHSLILELGVFAGLPLLILYLLLQGLALRSAIKIVTSNGDVQLKVIVLAWIGFNLQSAINPSSLALVTLGFVLTGVVYGAARNLEGDSIAKKLQRPPKNRATRKGLGVRVMVSTLAVSIAGGGIYIATVPIVKDARFRDAFEQGDGRRMIEVSRQWPFNYQLSRQTAITLKANSYDNLAIGIVRDLVRENPYNIQGWRMLFEYSTTASERSRALNKMREIDPLNPEFAKLAP